MTRGVVSRVTTLAYEDDTYGIGIPELIAVQVCYECFSQLSFVRLMLPSITETREGFYTLFDSTDDHSPAFNEKGDVVGVAFSGLGGGQAENIGHSLILYCFQHDRLYYSKARH